MTNTPAGWPQGWPWNSREVPVAGQAPIMLSVDTWRYGKIPSYVKPDWSPYALDDFLLVVNKIEGDFADISMVIWTWELANFRVLWENNEPKILTDGNRQLLYTNYDSEQFHKDSPKNLIDPYLNKRSPSIPYPFVIIEQEDLKHKYIVIGSNEDGFYRCFCPAEFETVILYKKQDRYIKVKFEEISTDHKRDLLSEKEELPTKNKMFLIWGKLMVWDEFLFRFVLVRKEWIVFTRVEEWGENTYAMRIWNDTTYFSASKENPNEPAWVTINWKFLLIRQGELFNYVHIGHKEYKINLDVSFEARWTFYQVEGEGKNLLYTDWENCYDFVTDKDGKVKLFHYWEWDYPILRDEDNQGSYWRQKLAADNGKNWVKVLFIHNQKPEEVYLVKNRSKNKKAADKKLAGKAIDSNYIRLQFTPEQQKKARIFVDTINWIVCIWDDGSSNTSQFWFYRINQDGTLTFVFKNNYNIKIDGKIVKIKCCSNSDSCRYTLVRKPWTTSIFEPININGSAYLVAEWKSHWELIYISLDSYHRISVENIKINPSTFLPANSFNFGNEIIYFYTDWTIKIRNKFYSPVNQNGGLLKPQNISEAVYTIWGKQILLLRSASTHRDEILAYPQWVLMVNNEELPEISHCTQLSRNGFRRDGNTIKTISIDGTEYICSLDYPEINVLWIYEIFEDWLFFRYINKKGEKWILEWEEFTCNDEKVDIVEIVSEEYLKSNDGRMYYRPWKSRILTLIDNLPRWVSFSDNQYICTINCEKSSLLMEKWKLVAISDKYADYYKLVDYKWECIFNWKKLNLVHAWDQRRNILVSFIKDWENYELFRIWKYTICAADWDSYTVWWTDIQRCVITNSIGEELNTARIWSISSRFYWIISRHNFKDEDPKWAEVMELEEGKYSIWAIYEINWEMVAINPKDTWYKIKLTDSWEITIGWIACNKEQLKGMYEELRPKTEPQVDKLTKTVSDQVWDIHNKGE